MVFIDSNREVTNLLRNVKAFRDSWDLWGTQTPAVLVTFHPIPLKTLGLAFSNKQKDEECGLGSVLRCPAESSLTLPTISLWISTIADVT